MSLAACFFLRAVSFFISIGIFYIFHPFFFMDSIHIPIFKWYAIPINPERARVPG